MGLASSVISSGTFVTVGAGQVVVGRACKLWGYSLCVQGSGGLTVYDALTGTAGGVGNTLVRFYMGISTNGAVMRQSTVNMFPIPVTAGSGLWATVSGISSVACLYYV